MKFYIWFYNWTAPTENRNDQLTYKVLWKYFETERDKNTWSCWMWASMFLLFSPLDICRFLVSLSYWDFLDKRINRSASVDVIRGGIWQSLRRDQNMVKDIKDGKVAHLRWRYEEIPLLALMRFPPFCPLSSSPWPSFGHLSSPRPSSLELDPNFPSPLSLKRITIYGDNTQDTGF